jgi:ribosome-associated translation inhibitor RaiA
MKVIIKTKNLELPGVLKDFVEKKFYGLKKFINILKREDEIGKTLAEVFVEMEKETKHHRKGDIFLVKSRIYLPGREIISQVRTDDLQKAIIKSKDELKLEIEKYKFRMIDKNRRLQRKTKKELKI